MILDYLINFWIHFGYILETILETKILVKLKISIKFANLDNFEIWINLKFWIILLNLSNSYFKDQKFEFFLWIKFSFGFLLQDLNFSTFLGFSRLQQY